MGMWQIYVSIYKRIRMECIRRAFSSLKFIYIMRFVIFILNNIFIFKIMLHMVSNILNGRALMLNIRKILYKRSD